jgi:phosphatidate cytidylyltransferase
MKERIITGIAMLAIIAIIFAINNFFLIWLFLGTVTLVALGESLDLFGIRCKIPSYAVTSIVWVVAFFYNDPAVLIFGVFLVYTSYALYRGDVDFDILKPILYPVASFLVMLSLYSQVGISSFIWLILSVAGTDTGAYFVGKKFGQRKFSNFSPNKTIEGVLGGIAVGTALGTLVFYSTYGMSALYISLAISFFSVWGDLFESMLKRQANVKDSGNLLPGHGGVLDRVDGYLFASVAMYILLMDFS